MLVDGEWQMSVNAAIKSRKVRLSPGKYRCGKAHSAKDNQNDSVLWRMTRVRTC